MTSGGNYDGNLSPGGFDRWAFSANAGETIILRTGSSNFLNQVSLFAADGTLLTILTNEIDSLLTFQPAQSGNYTVTVSNANVTGGGAYRLHFIKTDGPYSVPPGDEGGPITAGKTYPGTTDLGDEDIFTLMAFKNVPITVYCLRMTGTLSYAPAIRIYLPTGALAATASSSHQAQFKYIPPVTGRYTLLVDSYWPGNTGTYQLSGVGFTDGVRLKTSIAAGTVTVSATGGVSNAPLVLLNSSTGYSSSANWNVLANTQFDGSGNFTTNYPLISAPAGQFFNVLLP